MLSAGANALRETVFYSARGHQVAVPSEWFTAGATALGISRSEMDHCLLERARAVGVTILEGAHATGLILQNDVVCGVKAKTSTGATEYRARLSIDATGRTRALAVSSVKRSTILPEMPTIAETVPGFNMVGWQGFLVPAGTPGEIIQRLHREIAAVLALPEVHQRVLELGYETVGSSPREFAEFMRADTAQFARIISGAGIRPE